MLSSNQMNKAKIAPLLQLASQKVDHEWGSCGCRYPECYGAEDSEDEAEVFDSEDEAEVYGTFLSGASFLARFVKQSRHPEAYRMPNWCSWPSPTYGTVSQNEWMIHCRAADWKDLRKLRPD
jgi:hypothetical protein